MNPLSWPAVVALEITPHCNNRCPGCSNVYAGQRLPQVTPAAQWEAWLAQCAPEATQLRVTGGEPTLHPEFFRIIDSALSFDAWVTLFTNGRWRDPQALFTHLRGREHFSGMLVSLHGATASSHEAFNHTPGSFHETVRNIRRAVDDGISVTISTVMTRQSIAEIDALLALRENLGASHIAFNRYIGPSMPEIEPAVTDMRESVEKIERLIAGGQPLRYGIGVPQCFSPNASEGCLAGVAYVSIDPWGRLRPCAHSPSIVGSLHEAPFVEVWNSAGMDAWRGRMPGVCLACAAYSTCHGGCRAAQEVRPEGRDALRCDPLTERPRPADMLAISPEWKLRATCRLRPEAFGYAALGNGAVLPVRREAQAVILACDGQRTVEELVDTFGGRAVSLVGELLRRGLLEIA